MVDNRAYFFGAALPLQSDHRTVTNRKAIQELVQIAMAAEAGEGPFDADGLTATVAMTPDDEARLVEVSDHAKVIFSSCFVGPGAARPSFYPADVPFDNRAPTSVVWGPEQGTLVVWPVPSRESVLEAFREQVEQFAATCNHEGSLQLHEFLATKDCRTARLRKADMQCTCVL